MLFVTELLKSNLSMQNTTIAFVNARKNGQLPLKIKEFNGRGYYITKIKFREIAVKAF